jgi:hypothetical protein
MSEAWREVWIKLRLVAWWLLAGGEERRSMLRSLAAARRRRAWKARLLAAEAARLAAQAQDLADGCPTNDGDGVEVKDENSETTPSTTHKGGF